MELDEQINKDTTMAKDQSGSIENSKEQLDGLDDNKLCEILEPGSLHGENNRRWAREILTERRLERLEKLVTSNTTGQTLRSNSLDPIVVNPNNEASKL